MSDETRVPPEGGEKKPEVKEPKPATPPPPAAKPAAPPPPAAKPAAPPPAPPAAKPAAPAPAAPDAKSISALVGEYQKAVKLNSIVRVTFPLFALALICVFLIIIWLNLSAAFPERKVTAETIKAGEQVLPVLNKVMRSFVDEVAPMLVEEFERGLSEGSERLMEALATEIGKMEENTHAYVKTKVQESIALTKAKHKELLQELYPDLKGEQLELASTKLNKAFEMWTVKYMLDIMNDLFEQMFRINETVIKNYRPMVVEGEVAPVKEAELLELGMELLNAAYDAEEAAAAAADEKKDGTPSAKEGPAEEKPAEEPAEEKPAEEKPAEEPAAEAPAAAPEGEAAATDNE